MAYQILMPGRTIVGADAIASAKENIRALGQHPLVISGKIVEKSGIVKKLTDVLSEAGMEYTVFTEIKGEPDDLMVSEAKKEFDRTGCDMVIGIGGGSPQDSAKAVSAASGYVPIVLIPTTAGSGSEATKFYCVTESATNTKKLITDEKIIPSLAILDPSLSVTAPKSITAATGMDALTHAVEAFTSRKATPFTDMLAISAVKRVFEYLPEAYENGESIKARTEMSFAAYEAGICINNASVTLVHGMSRPIGALFHVPHGISNAMLLRECLTFAKDGCLDRFGELGRALGASGSDAECADTFFVYLEDLCRTLHIPTVEEYGIDRKEFFAGADKMADDAIASGSPANTRKEVGKKDILDIYTALWQK